jgi:hypothetical protein
LHGGGGGNNTSPVKQSGTEGTANTGGGGGSGGNGGSGIVIIRYAIDATVVVIPSISTVDTFVAPSYTNTYSVVIPRIVTRDTFHAPTIEIPVKRKRVGVNW